jgi:transposase-like protein
LDRQRLDPARRRFGAGDRPVQHSKSQVPNLCKDIDEWVNAFLDRPIKGKWPYLWLDTTYLKVRDVAALSRLRR